MDYLEGLDPHLKAFRQTVHILLHFLLHVHLPIELEVCNMEQGVHILESVDLGQAVLGLLQVTAIPMRSVYSESLVLQEGSIEKRRELLAGERVFRTFSGSDPTLLLGTDCSILHMLAAKCDCISDFSFMLSNLGMELMDLCPIKRLLRKLTLP